MIEGGLYDALSPESPQGDAQLVVAIGIVTNNQDPEGLGRVKVKFPWLSEDDESNWARVAAPMAGPHRGTYFLPEIDDEVVVAFDHGKIDCPIVIGALWNGKDKPPLENADGKNNVRVIKSRSGHAITFDDTEGAEQIAIADGTGKNSIVIDSKEGSIAITSDKSLSIKVKGNMTLEANEGDLVIKCKGLTIDTEQSFSIKAGQDGKVQAQSGLAIVGRSGVNINDGALKVK